MRRAPLTLALVSLALFGAGAAWMTTNALKVNHKLARSGRFHQTTQTMWATVSDVAASAAWRTDLRTLEPLPDVRGHEVWREVRPGGDAVTLETVERIGERRIVRCVIDQAGPFGGCWTVLVAPRDKVESVVTIEESLTVHSAAWRWTHFRGSRRAALDAYLRALGAKFGETPTLADIPRGL